MSTPNHTLSEDDIQRMRIRKAMARKKRIEREAAGEIKELNITAMMDMMTIILVFLIKSFASSSVAMTASDEVRPPISTTRESPKDTVVVTLTAKYIIVGDKPRAQLVGGDVASADVDGFLIKAVYEALKLEVAKAQLIAEKRGQPYEKELSVVADKSIPYSVLAKVLYTAGRAELERFRFIVLQKDG